jgi:hypothetical protein
MTPNDFLCPETATIRDDNDHDEMNVTVVQKLTGQKINT